MRLLVDPDGGVLTAVMSLLQGFSTTMPALFAPAVPVVCQLLEKVNYLPSPSPTLSPPRHLPTTQKGICTCALPKMTLPPFCSPVGLRPAWSERGSPQLLLPTLAVPWPRWGGGGGLVRAAVVGT